MAAITIINLDDVPRDFIVKDASGAPEIVTVPAKRRIRMIQPVAFISTSPESSGVFTRNGDILSYWPDGTFGIQMRRRGNSSSF